MQHTDFGDVNGSMSQEEFLKAYDLFADALFRHCFFRVRDRELAKDMVQETFTRAWAYIASGKTVENPRAFLYRIATNIVIDHSRKKKSVSLDEMREAGFEPHVDGVARLYTRIDAKRILDIVDRLDEKYKNLIILRYVEELGPKEIAGLLGESENVISVRLHRAMQQLRMLLTSYAQ